MKPPDSPQATAVRPYVIRTYDRWLILLLVLVVGWLIFRPLFAFSVYYRGVSYERMLELKVAEHYYRKSTIVDPKVPEGWQAWGELYLMRAPSDRAAANEGVRIFTQGLAYNPKAKPLAFDLGRTYFALKDYRNARIAFERSAEIAPTDMFSWDFAAWSSFRNGDRERALKYWHQVLKIDPGNATARRAIAQYGT
jgi:tetratricopeptide (TPR) repeat protein